MALSLLLMVEPAYAGVESCGKSLGVDVPRIRSSQVRMQLADPPAAAARFLPFAAMAALAYEEVGPQCKHQHPLVHKSDLQTLTGEWTPANDVPGQPECDDDLGLFYRVWKRDRPDALEVTIAFRGTGNLPDWLRGNLRWITRFGPGQDQYDRSRKSSRAVIDYFTNGAGKPAGGKPVRFYSTGHSLGGGLAQNVYYDQPERFVQAYAFDPSPVTGYMDQVEPTRREGCVCREEELGAEARIFRIYESSEILAWVRFPLKMALPLHRHIYEVRFGFESGNAVTQHGMEKFALHLNEFAAKKKAASSGPWYAGPQAESCTEKFVKAHKASCEAPAAEKICP